MTTRLRAASLCASGLALVAAVASVAQTPQPTQAPVYFTSETGEVYVIRAGPKFELLAENRLDEVCMATPAVSRGALLFRTRGHVVAVR